MTAGPSLDRFHHYTTSMTNISVYPSTNEKQLHLSSIDKLLTRP